MRSNWCGTNATKSYFRQQIKRSWIDFDQTHCLDSGFWPLSSTLSSLLLLVPISKILPDYYCCSRDASLQPLVLKISLSLIFLRRWMFSLETVSSTPLNHYLSTVKMYTSCFRYPRDSRSFPTTIIIVHKTGGGIFGVSGFTYILYTFLAACTAFKCTLNAPGCVDLW